MNDGQLRNAVAAGLELDPQVTSAEIHVSADNGVITLHGTAASVNEKLRITTSALRLRGVIGVDNRIEVRYPDVAHG